MRRGPSVPRHGACVPYQDVWDHTTRRAGDALPAHQQAGGINAGEMLLQPCANTYECMLAEIADDAHPEHYGTYMPEQEYLGRFYGTGSVWRHISCRYNFEVDKRERVPHDHTEEHERLLLSTPDEIVVLHYSGLGCKPWDLLLAVPGDFSSLAVASSAGLRSWAEKLQVTMTKPFKGQVLEGAPQNHCHRRTKKSKYGPGQPKTSRS
eukprot:340745-Amphidinium_carterae.1